MSMEVGALDSLLLDVTMGGPNSVVLEVIETHCDLILLVHFIEESLALDSGLVFADTLHHRGEDLISRTHSKRIFDSL